MTVSVANRFIWLLNQGLIMVLGVGLLSLIPNYGYRFLVDRHVDTPIFYVATLVIALVAFIALRRDYVFVSQFEFTKDAISVRTLLTGVKVFETSRYQFVPVLHKAIGFPEPKARQSFYVRDLQTGRNVRNYAWAGFSLEDFQAVSRLYGFSGETDFKL